jgi:hypothetical protein
LQIDEAMNLCNKEFPLFWSAINRGSRAGFTTGAALRRSRFFCRAAGQRNTAPAMCADRLSRDIVFNPAAYTAVDKAEDEPELAMRINAEAPGAMACWATARDMPLILGITPPLWQNLWRRNSNGWRGN